MFREDYLAKLTKLFVMWPDLQDQYLRLTPPRAEALYKIVRGPFEDSKLRQRLVGNYTEELAHRLIPRLLDRAEAQRVNLTEVQIVCSELWHSESPETLFERRGVQGLLEDYTSNAVDKLSVNNLKGAAIALLSRLVTPSGTRNIVVHDELIDRVHQEENIGREIVTRALDALESKTKLVVREQRHGTLFYEIVSEFLVPWIQQQKSGQLSNRRNKPLSHWSDDSLESAADANAITEHLAILKRGVPEWNKWRIAHPYVRPHLAGVDLRGASLHDVDLHDAQLSNADLTGADLVGANLSGANLSGAAAGAVRLERAYLKDVNLASASLVNAFLSDVMLERGNLSAADLTGADLRGSDLSYAMLVDAKLSGANLRTAGCKVSRHGISSLRALDSGI